MKSARRTASEDDSLQCQRIGTLYSRDNTPGFSILFFAIHQNMQCRVRMIENGFIRAFSDA